MSMRFTLEQLNPAMRMQAEAQLRGMVERHPARVIVEGREIKKAAEPKPKGPNRLEGEWLQQLRAARLPMPKTEYHFCPGRKWRFDTAYPELKTAFEVEGGIFLKGGGAHSRPSNIERDIEKYNKANLLGWRVYRVSSKMVKDGSGIALAEQVLGGLRCWP